MDDSDIAAIVLLVGAWTSLLAWQARRIWNLSPFWFVLLAGWGVPLGLAPFLFIPDDSIPNFAVTLLPVGIGPLPIFTVIWAFHITGLEAQRTRSQMVLNGQVTAIATKEGMAAANPQIDTWVSLGVISKQDGEAFVLNAKQATYWYPEK